MSKKQNIVRVSVAVLSKFGKKHSNRWLTFGIRRICNRRGKKGKPITVIVNCKEEFLRSDRHRIAGCKKILAKLEKL